MVPSNNRCKWSSIFLFLLSVSVAVLVAVADDKSPAVEDGTLFTYLHQISLFFSGLCVIGFSQKCHLNKNLVLSRFGFLNPTHLCFKNRGPK